MSISSVKKICFHLFILSFFVSNSFAKSEESMDIPEDPLLSEPKEVDTMKEDTTLSIDDLVKQKEAEASALKKKEVEDNPLGLFKWSVGIGSDLTTINKNALISINLTPMVGYEKFEFALNLHFTMTSEFDFYKKDWTTARGLLSQIDHVSYGEIGSKYYVGITPIEGVTFASGLLVNNFQNIYQVESVRDNGFYSATNFKYGGYTAFAESIADFDIFGMRGFVKPLAFLDSEPYNKFEIGLSIVTDLDPLNVYHPWTYYYLMDNDESSPVVGYSFDFLVPIYFHEWFSIDSYFEFAGLSDGGTAQTLGIKGVTGKYVLYLFETKFAQNGYQFGYFDTLYQAHRKDYAADTSTEDYYGYKFSLGLTAFDQGLFLGFFVEGTYNSVINPKVGLDFYASVDLLKYLSLRFSWYREDITSGADLFAFDDGKTWLEADIRVYPLPSIHVGMKYKRTFGVKENYSPDEYTVADLYFQVVF